MSSRHMRVVTGGRISFYFMADQCPAVHPHRIFFVRASIHGRLSPYLGYCGNSPMNWECSSLFEIVTSFILDEYPAVGLLGDMLVLVLILGGISILLSIVATPVCIPS